VSDGQGVPLAVQVTAGQAHESTQFEKVLDAVRIRRPRGRPRQRPDAVACDKAYSIPRIREWLRRKLIQDVIPTKVDQPMRSSFNRELYRQRNVVERCVGWLKECRRIATRYEKLALNFVAMLKFAMIQRYLSIAFSDTP
jgi:transposase